MGSKTELYFSYFSCVAISATCSSFSQLQDTFLPTYSYFTLLDFFYFGIIVIYQVRVAQLVKVLDLNQNIPALNPKTKKYVYTNSQIIILSSITTSSSFLKHLLYTNFTHILHRP